MIACPAGGGRTVRWACPRPETPAGTGAPAGTARGLPATPAALADPEVVAGPPEQPASSRQAAAVSAAAAGAAARVRFARETARNDGADMPIGRPGRTGGSARPVTSWHHVRTGRVRLRRRG